MMILIISFAVIFICIYTQSGYQTIKSVKNSDMIIQKMDCEKIVDLILDDEPISEVPIKKPQKPIVPYKRPFGISPTE